METESARASNTASSVNLQYPDFLSDAYDGCPPKCIFDAYEKYTPKSASEIMNILVHLSMIDSSFKLCSEENSSSLPKNWREIATTFKYSRPSYLLNETSPPTQVEFNCSIVAVTMGSTKQVLASFVGQDTEISVKFDMNQYIPEGTLDPTKLKRLSHFDCQFRNEVLYPLRISAHKILGLPSPWHLLGLPYDIMLLILKLLPIRDILNLSLTCTAMKNTVDDQRVWFNLFKRDFSTSLTSSDGVVSCMWKDRYKSAYVRRHKLVDPRIESDHTLYDDSLRCRIPRMPNWNGIPGAYFDPIAPDLNPYGPISDIYPSGPDPFGDPDSRYYRGELAPPRRGGRIRSNIFPPGFGHPGSSRGGPRIHFL